VYDYRQHRDHFAEMAKRSKCFMVAPGKTGSLTETQGQSEVGHRYYEGAAAGAVMLGEAPTGDSFRQMFPWVDAVIPVRPDGSDLNDTLAELSANPARTIAAGLRNAVGALLRHDWVYRWKELLKITGLEPSPGMTARELRLKEIAATLAGPCEPDALLEADPRAALHSARVL